MKNMFKMETVFLDPDEMFVILLGEISQMWVGGVADSQTRSKPLKKKITSKIVLFDPNFTFRSPKSHKNPGVGKQIWERSPKKTFFLYLP